MKAGDKLYCKKTIIDVYNEIYFIENKCYTIININDLYLNLIDENGEKWFFATINQLNDQYRLKDHFATEKEYRKLKLEKLNESR